MSCEDSSYCPSLGEETKYSNPYTYTGRRADEELGLLYSRARYYDPQTGEFISRDPLGYVDGMSQYRGYFVPGATDPSGLSCPAKKKCGVKAKKGFDQKIDCGILKQPSGYKLGLQFVGNFEFKNDAEHSCHCCQYRQYVVSKRVKGFVTLNGKEIPIGDAKEDKRREDKKNGSEGYGHRDAKHPFTWRDLYYDLPTGATVGNIIVNAESGCHYTMRDSPGLPVSEVLNELQGLNITQIRMEATWKFQWEIIDTCEGGVVDTETKEFTCNTKVDVPINVR